jgi:hypothetical protein
MPAIARSAQTRVGGVEKCSDAFLTEALSYLENPQEGATVVLRHTGASVRGKKKASEHFSTPPTRTRRGSPNSDGEVRVSRLPDV